MDYPLINGTRPDWAQTFISIDGADDEIGIKELNYSDENEAGEVYGAGSFKIGDTLGTYKAEGSMTLYKDEAADFINSLGNGFYTKKFNIIVSYLTMMGDTEQYVTDTLVGCRIKKVDASNSQGTDPTAVKFDLSFFRIKWNGKLPMPDMLEG